MKSKYINVEEKLFKEGFNITQALLISYLKRFQQQGKYCFQSKKQIADFFNISESTIRREIKELESKGIIFTSTEKKYIPVSFNNRKALVLVENNSTTSNINSSTEIELDDDKQEVLHFGRFNHL